MTNVLTFQPERDVKSLGRLFIFFFFFFYSQYEVYSLLVQIVVTPQSRSPNAKANNKKLRSSILNVQYTEAADFFILHNRIK